MSGEKTLVQEFEEWIKTAPIEAVQSRLGVFPSTVKRWRENRKPSLEVFERWLISRSKDEPLPDSPETIEMLRRKLFGWEGKKVAILFPCYKDTNPVTAWCLTAAALDLGKDRARFFMECGDAVIANARNKLAKSFLEETECEWSIWLDDDVIPPIGRPDFFRKMCRCELPDAIAGRHFVTRLLSHKKTVVGGVYFGRRPNAPPMFHAGIYNRGARDDSVRMSDKLIETEWVATGCLAVHRQVYLDIQAKFPELAPTEYRKEWDFFRMFRNDGEDVSFCKRAIDAGHKVYADTGCVCGHVGRSIFGAFNYGKIV